MQSKVVVIGSGFAGMSAAGFLARDGYNVTLIEKHHQTGGRARHFEAHGFTFDMGPSWYWMPEVFSDWFAAFDKRIEDYYTLQRLDPSYGVWFSESDRLDIPAGEEKVIALFESIEPGAGAHLRQFLKEAQYKYEVGVGELVFKPGESVMEFADRKLLAGMLRLHVFKSFSKYVRKYFKDPRLIQILEFPVLFLGAMPEKIPALYSLMNYADISLGTWYPMGGMSKIVEGMESVIREQGVDIQLNTPATRIAVENGKAIGVYSHDRFFEADHVISAADYHHTEKNLLESQHRSYSEKYWNKRVMAPSCLLWYLGIDRKVPGLHHHNLFFDAPFKKHAQAIYESPEWPEEPLFYTCCPSKTDDSVAPAGKENVFLLIPTAPGLEDTPEIREKFFQKVMDRLQTHLQIDLRKHIVYQKSYAYSNFIEDYHAFKGNAYGLANTLMQTANLKPALRSKKVKELYFAGQLTLPGPGVPPSLISGEVVARLINSTKKVPA